jgi:hypothetical protein
MADDDADYGGGHFMPQAADGKGGSDEALAPPDDPHVSSEEEGAATKAYPVYRITPELNALPPQGPESLQAVQRLLARYGTDVSGVRLFDYEGNPVAPR